MAYTTTGTVDYVQTAYDMLAYYALRPELYFDQVADIKPTNQSMPGSSVVFNVQNDIALATTSLNESTDITPVALTSSQVTLTLAEFGGGTLTTAAVRAESFVSIDEVQANAVGYWAGRSVDELAKMLTSWPRFNSKAAATSTTQPVPASPQAPLDSLRPRGTRSPPRTPLGPMTFAITSPLLRGTTSLVTVGITSPSSTRTFPSTSGRSRVTKP